MTARATYRMWPRVPSKEQGIGISGNWYLKGNLWVPVGNKICSSSEALLSGEEETVTVCNGYMTSYRQKNDLCFVFDDVKLIS